MKKILVVLACVALFGCGPKPDMPLRQRMQSDAAVQDNDRVEVTRIGVFRDDLAYYDKRGVYLIHDKLTGREYIGISGVGITEAGSHPAGKIRVQDEK